MLFNVIYLFIGREICLIVCLVYQYDITNIGSYHGFISQKVNMSSEVKFCEDTC